MSLRTHSRVSIPMVSLILLGAQSPGPRVATPSVPSTEAAGTCIDTITDQSGGPCLEASSTPSAGRLFPPPHDGGLNNISSGPWSFSGGGRDNQATAFYSTVGGGYGNVAAGYYASVGGGASNTASSYAGTVSGGSFNLATTVGATIGGGYNNVVHGIHATVSGGLGNSAYGSQSVVGGGSANAAHGFQSAIVGGSDGTASSTHTFIGGGRSNTASNPEAAVVGGFDNRATGPRAAIGGGQSNLAEGSDSTIPGGWANSALGPSSLAAGRRAVAAHAGSFVWGDSVDVDKRSSRHDEFNVYASGGTRIFSDEFGATGVKLRPGGGSWSTLSDRRSKEHIEEVDVEQVLERLLAMPVSTWNYRAQDVEVRHMGPMAQDFHAAFGLGGSDVLIDTVDTDGVALAAIKGLAAQVHVRDAEIVELRERLEALRAELHALGTDVVALRAEDRAR